MLLSCVAAVRPVPVIKTVSRGRRALIRELACRKLKVSTTSKHPSPDRTHQVSSHYQDAVRPAATLPVNVAAIQSAA